MQAAKDSNLGTGIGVRPKCDEGKIWHGGLAGQARFEGSSDFLDFNLNPAFYALFMQKHRADRRLIS